MDQRYLLWGPVMCMNVVQRGKQLCEYKVWGECTTECQEGIQPNEKSVS